MHRRRYEVLASIPRELRLIRSLIDEAARLPASSPARVAKIIEAAKQARLLMARLTGSPPLWLAVQRQFLMHGWSFQDLEELDKLPMDAHPFVKVLTELHTTLPPDQQPSGPDPERLVERAWDDFHRVRDQAVVNMQVSGVAMKDGTDGVWLQVGDATVVDRTHEQLQRLLDELDWRLADAERYDRQRQAYNELSQADREQADRESERRWRQVLGVCAEAVTVVAAITTVMVQAPEIWDDIQPYAAELVRMVGQVGEALSRQVALLGMVIAIRQADQALGIDPGGSSDPPGGPGDDPSPTGDPSHIAPHSGQPQTNEGFASAKEPTSPYEALAQADETVQWVHDASAAANVDLTAPADPDMVHTPGVDLTEPVDPDMVHTPRVDPGDTSVGHDLDVIVEIARGQPSDDDNIKPGGPTGSL